MRRGSLSRILGLPKTFDWLIFHYFLQLMSLGLAWKSAAKSNEKLLNQKYATLFLSWMPFSSNMAWFWKCFCRKYKNMSYTIEWSLISHSKESNCIQRYVQVLPFLVIVFLFDKDHALFWTDLVFFYEAPRVRSSFPSVCKKKKIKRTKISLKKYGFAETKFKSLWQPCHRN